jgi:Flp pilus assembly protein TadD
MSIIYGTLERLENEHHSFANRAQVENTLRQNNPATGSLLRTVVTTLLFVLAGANLTLWYWSHGSARPTALSPATNLLPVKPHSEPQALPAGEQDPIEGISSQPVNAVNNSTDTAAPGMPITGTGNTDIQKVALLKTTSEQNLIETPSPAVQAEVNPQSNTGKKGATRPTETTEQEQAYTHTVVTPVVVAVDDMVDDARLALAKGNYQRALAVLQELVPIPHNRADFWLIKGSAHLGAGQLDLAESALASARELAPYNAQIAVQQAILKQETGDHRSALKILGSIADKHPDVPEIFLNQGYSQYAVGDERAATRSFRIFLRLTAGRSLYAGQRKAIEDWLTTENSVR